jgi:molybdopterin-binding protein
VALIADGYGLEHRAVQTPRSGAGEDPRGEDTVLRHDPERPGTPPRQGARAFDALFRLPGTIVAIEPLALPYVRVTFDLGSTRLDALVTTESVERLGLEIGLRAWAMIKTVAIGKDAVEPDHLPEPRSWPLGGRKHRVKR